MTAFRRHGRKALNTTLTLKHKSFGNMEAEIKDVSATGMFVLCEDLLEKVVVGDAVTASSNPGSSLNTTELKVVRLTDKGAGFAYD